MRIALTVANISEKQIEQMQENVRHLYGESILPCSSSSTVQIYATAECQRAEIGDLSLAMSGYMTASSGETEAVVEAAFKCDGGPLINQETLGGIHAAHISDGKRGLCWPSIPASGGLYYAQWGKGVIVCNRPRLIAECIGLELDPKYTDYLITIGYPLDDTTPFVGVKSVRGHEAIWIDRSYYKIVPRTLANFGSISKSKVETDATDKAFRSELMRAVAAVDNFSRVEFRLSGGKDSRLIAAALYKSGKKTIAHTRGFGSEFDLASMISEVIGFQHIQSALEVDDADLFDRTAAVLHLTDGLIETEAHVGLAVPEAMIKGQDGIIYGHSHLQKGGMARTMGQRYEPQAVAFLEAGVVPFFVRDVIRQKLIEELNVIKNWFEYKAKLDILYYPYAVLRAGRYLEPLYAKIETRFTPIFPLNDERMYIACSNLNRNRRTTEKTIFNTVKDFCPKLIEIPLKDDKWRFQKPEEKLVQSSDQRAQDPKAKEVRSKVVSDIKRASEKLVNSAILARAEELLDKEILIKCGLLEGNHENKHPNFTNRHREKLIMRLWFAHVAQEVFL